jgi:hypothetical protein
MTATLNSSHTADAVYAALPLEGLAQTDAGYVYFSVPLTLPEEDIKETVSAGVVAYWPVGTSICIFFGGLPPTGVNIIGSLNGNAMQWRNVVFGSIIKMEKA